MWWSLSPPSPDPHHLLQLLRHQWRLHVANSTRLDDVMGKEHETEVAVTLMGYGWPLLDRPRSVPNTVSNQCWPVSVIVRKILPVLLGSEITCRIASLCISWSLHAGIISFRTPNSSFILDLRLRSIKLCAVLRAIFLPATLVELGCFLVPAAVGRACEPGVAFLPEPFGVVCGVASFISSWLCCALGFIWIIFRDLVGGGGNEKSEVVAAERCCWLLDERFRLSDIARAGDVGDTGW